MSAGKKARARFDAAYYEKHYDSPQTRVHDDAKIAALARGILGFAQWWGLDVKTILDVGAGTGRMRKTFEKLAPRAKYVGTDHSEYACEKYGHDKLDITSERIPMRFDLVLCHSVLPYLDDRGCARAIDNLAAMSSGLLFIEAITKSDIRVSCDPDATDLEIHARPASFYESRLKRGFIKVGAGFYASKQSGLVFYELERA